MLKKLLKNQFFIVNKKWINFVAIFIMLVLSAFLIGGSLSTSKNINSIFNSLKNSNIFKYSFTFVDKDWRAYKLTDKAFDDIKEHFYVSSYVLTSKEKAAIMEAQPIKTIYHQEEIANWNYDFIAWLLNHTLITNLENNNFTLSISNQIVNEKITSNNKLYHTLIYSYFNDKDWKALNNQVLSSNIIMQKGRIPEALGEIVVTPNDNPDFQLAQEVFINNKKYNIVGFGYTHEWYQASSWNPTYRSIPHMYLKYSEFNNNLWLNRSFWGDNNYKYIGYFIQMDGPASILKNTLSNFIRDYALNYDALQFSN
ncbi:hypothetical protein [Spiroplasma sp. DGKH1]|uniref:hypothetical protein n=1 Tax=Spiroplasma sp. DGKH1 TaxID=3050074 RepID=UPI0034C5C030